MDDQKLVLNWKTPADIRSGLQDLSEFVLYMSVDAEKADCLMADISQAYFGKAKIEDPDTKCMVLMDYHRFSTMSFIASDYVLSLKEKLEELLDLLDDAIEQVHVPKIGA